MAQKAKATWWNLMLGNIAEHWLKIETKDQFTTISAVPMRLVMQWDWILRALLETSRNNRENYLNVTSSLVANEVVHLAVDLYSFNA